MVWFNIMRLKQHFQAYKIVNNLVSVSSNMCFGSLTSTAAQKNSLIETVLLSTNNICFGQEITKEDKILIMHS